jgi:nitroreductase
VPASIEWRPDEDWTLSAAWFPLVNVAVEARRRLTASWSLLAFYRTDTQIFFLADRQLDAERFYVFDQRAAVGLERVLGNGFSLEAMASWLFDRELFQGTNFTSGRIDSVQFDPGPGLSLQVLWRR